MIARIGGLLDWSALTALAHPDLRQLANLTSGCPVDRLTGDGLSILGVAAALGLSTDAVRQLLNQEDKR